MSSPDQSEVLRTFRIERSSFLGSRSNDTNSYGVSNFSAFARDLYSTSHATMRRVLQGERPLTRRFIEECAVVLQVEPTRFSSYKRLPHVERSDAEKAADDFLRTVAGWVRATAPPSGQG